MIGCDRCNNTAVAVSDNRITAITVSILRCCLFLKYALDSADKIRHCFLLRSAMDRLQLFARFESACE